MTLLRGDYYVAKAFLLFCPPAFLGRRPGYEFFVSLCDGQGHSPSRKVASEGGDEAAICVSTCVVRLPQRRSRGIDVGLGPGAARNRLHTSLYTTTVIQIHPNLS